MNSLGTRLFHSIKSFPTKTAYLYVFVSFFVFQGKKLKPEQETDNDEEGYVTDEDEAADISPEAAAGLEKAGEGAEGAATTGVTASATTASASTASAPTDSASPPVKKKEKKPKKVRKVIYKVLISADEILKWQLR